MNILFLDDDLSRCRKFRRFVPSATVVHTAEDCINKLSESWDFVLLDHDLGGEVFVPECNSNTGSEVVRWVGLNKPDVGRFIVHSLNAPARVNMYSSLRSFGYNVREIPFILLIDWLDKGDLDFTNWSDDE